MRIALVTETFPPEINGVAMTLERLSRGLVARGHELTVIHPPDPERPLPAGMTALTDQPGMLQSPAGWRELRVPGMKLPKYDELRLGLPCRSRLVRQWRSDRPQVVHIATEGFLGLSALWAARRLKIPCTSSFHTNFHTYGRHYGLGLLADLGLAYMRYLHNRTAMTMVPSHDVLRSLADRRFQRLVILGRGVDTGLFDPARRQASLRQAWLNRSTPGGERIAVYVGRIAPEKNLSLLERAFDAMRQVDPGWRLVLIGSGPAQAALQSRRPDFIFTGMKRGVELAEHVASGDALLFASVTETFGNVVTESAASGLAIVTYDYAAAREHFTHGQNALLAALHDEAGYIRQAVSLARQPQRIAELGAAARAKAVTLGWSSIVDRFEDYLKQVSPP